MPDSSETDLLTITELFAVGPSSTTFLAIPFSGNSSGSLVGYQVISQDVAELWQGTTVTQIGTLPGYNYNIAEAVNDTNEVVGKAFSSFGQSNIEQGFLWQAGTLTAIGPANGHTEATGINNNGVVVGLTGSPGGNYSAFEWQSGALTLLPSLPGASIPSPGTLASAVAINDTGEIVGQSATSTGTIHAVYWLNGAVTDMGTLPGTSSSVANAINASGQIVGSSGNLAFLWKNGGISALQSLANFTNIQAVSINSAGLVVGEAYDANPSSSSDVPHAVLWENGQVVDLNSLLPVGSPWVLTAATTITDNDQVYGLAYYNNVQIPYVLSLGSQTSNLTAQTTISSFQAGRTVTPAEVIDSAANIQKNLDGLENLASAHLLNVIFLTDSSTPSFSVTGEQLASDGGVLQAISGHYSLTVTTPTTASALSLWMAGHLIGTAVLDTAANVSSNFDLIEDFASSVSFTDPGIPTLALSATQADRLPNLTSKITGNYAVDVSVTAPYQSVSGIAGHGVTVSFAGPSTQFTVSPQGNGAVLVTSSTLSSNLDGINAIHFSDLTEIVAQTPGPGGHVTTGNITELYSAVLGREPDVAGLAFYQNYLAANPNTSLLQFAQWFLASPEYSGNPAHVYAQNTPGETQFITDSYQNLLHRTAVAAEIAFYQTNVIQPALTGLTPGTTAYAAADAQAHAQLLVYFSASPEFLSDVQITAQNPASAQHWLVLV